MATRLQLDELSPLMHRDALNMMLGKELGRGTSRTVFANDLLPTTVVKVEAGAGLFQNVLEWKIWEEVKGTPLAKWFAPCRFISPNGMLLIQDRTYQPRHYPEKIPSFFTDLKVNNFGQIGDMFVAHDYGLIRLGVGLGNRMRTAKWWDVDYR